MIIESPPIHHFDSHQIATSAVADGSSCATASTASAPWSFATNWTVYRGSLDDSVTFESPDFPVDESMPRKPPLVLVPPHGSDYEPCEIKISFTQKHEIRQVYIRSTSRVYEIYCAPALQSDDEYLCTVRCSVASVEENLLPATDVNDSVSLNFSGPNGVLSEEKVVAENNNNGTNEDDWVEVKLSADRLDERTASNSRSYQDYYEATAEINDSDPCMSITLRLLSLQSKGCLCVDEVYVFADPIDSSDPEDQGLHVENPSGSKLLTMLLPSLLQSAKYKAGQLQDQQTSKSMEEGERLETESIPSNSTNTANIADQPDQKLADQREADAESSSFKVVRSTPDRHTIGDSAAKNDLSISHAEKVLEQLVTRVNRIEDICLRFEENMLKPISNMEERLQRVEQQVELLAKSSEFHRPPCCPRAKSNPNFSINHGIYPLGCDASELVKKQTSSDETYKPPEDKSWPVSNLQLLPSLVVTAPEFSCFDDEEVNDAPESSKNSPEEKPKKALSIDDALAAALAGFSSSNSVQHPKGNDNVTVASPKSLEEECLKCTQAPINTTLGSNSNEGALNFSESLKVTAPEFTGDEKFSEALKVTAPEFTWEENGNDDCFKCTIAPIDTTPGLNSNEGALKFSESLKVTAPEFTGEENGDDDEVILPRCQNEKTVAPESSAIGVLECPGERTSSTATMEIPDNSFHLQGTSRVVDGTSDAQLVEGLANRVVKVLNSGKADILRHFPANVTTNASETLASSTITSEVMDGYETKVDFETPILEVKFSSLGNGGLESPLEVLLYNTGEPILERNHETMNAQETDGQFVEEEETTSQSVNELLVELDGDIIGELSLCVVEDAVQQDHLSPINQETFTNLI